MLAKLYQSVTFDTPDTLILGNGFDNIFENVVAICD